MRIKSIQSCETLSLGTKWRTILTILVAVSVTFLTGAFTNHMVAPQVRQLGSNTVIEVPLGQSSIETLTSPNPQPYRGFGFPVATGSDVVAVGASGESVGGQDLAGRVYLFNVETGGLVNTLVSPNAQTGGGFGFSIAIGGSLLVVGASGETVNGQFGAGRVYVFNVQTGALTSILTSPDPQPEGEFGISVAASGNVAVVGDPLASLSGQSMAGRIYTFNAESGALIRTITSPGAQSGGRFGSSIASSGNILAVGAPSESVGEQNFAGRVYAFNLETGGLVNTFTSPNSQSGGFGYSVDMSGNTLLVGTPFETVGGHYLAGRVYTFNAQNGSLVSVLASPNAQYFGLFGFVVAASGSIVIVGAPQEYADRLLVFGHAYEFNLETGALVGVLTNPDTQPYGRFGYSVAASGNAIIVGSLFTGQAYIF